MRVKFFADIRTYSGCLEREWTRPAADLHELLLGLGAEHGRAFLHRVLPDGRLSTNLIVLVNGQSIVHLGGLQAPLTPDDTVAIFPVVAGG